MQTAGAQWQRRLSIPFIDLEVETGSRADLLHADLLELDSPATGVLEEPEATYGGR
jgi:hypothetical protein